MRWRRFDGLISNTVVCVIRSFFIAKLTPYRWRPFLRDPDEDMVLECAVASGCEFIVTHNVRDFRRVEELNVRAITPAGFLNRLRSPT